MTVLVAGKGTADVAKEAAQVQGVDNVISVEDDAMDHAVAENVTELVKTLQGAKSFSHILTASTNEGKNILPRISAVVSLVFIYDRFG